MPRCARSKSSGVGQRLRCACSAACGSRRRPCPAASNSDERAQHHAARIVAAESTCHRCAAVLRSIAMRCVFAAVVVWPRVLASMRSAALEYSRRRMRRLPALASAVRRSASPLDQCRARTRSPSAPPCSAAIDGERTARAARCSRGCLRSASRSSVVTMRVQQRVEQVVGVARRPSRRLRSAACGAPGTRRSLRRDSTCGE